MVTTLLLLATVAVLGSVGWGVLRHERVDETERFHRASEITSSWAAPGPRFQTVPADGPPADAGPKQPGRDEPGD
jgi:hypothetical protein